MMMPITVKRSLSVFSLSLGLIGGWMVPGIEGAIAQTLPTEIRQIRTLTVTGRGTHSIPTTLTQIQLGVEVQGKSATEVQEEAAQRSNAVVNLLKSRNVQKLETTGIRLNPIYSYENNVQRLTGYVAVNTVSFRVTTAQAGTLLDEAVRVGATRIDSVGFVAEDAAIAAAQKEALQEATQDAQAQADAVLAVLNLSRKEIIGIQINGSTPVPPPIFVPKEAMMRVADAAPTPVVGGEQEVQATVTLQIRY